MLNVSRLYKESHEQDIQVMVEGPGHVPLNEVSHANVMTSEIAYRECSILCSGSFSNRHSYQIDHIASAIGARCFGANKVTSFAI